MADFDNLSAINENFDTIKTLLNSIRAQGILNTSDVDKLLTGIYSKLEKINTEEDIDLIKIFLSELKHNLDERHGILVSKFGAIESLFTNLLKNSSEMPKSAELKELFDIVATNLSVFSREVVSQKEALTDITLRLDALRSDDSQKKDIIKNIGALRPDLERLNNGFDSIVINLNDNFKTVIKSITALDNTENFAKFSSAITGMEMSFSTILSALQMLDKKTEKVDDFVKTLATKEDFATARQKLFELTAQGNELSAILTDLSERYVRIDNLSEKIDASVNIVASLKSFLEESDNTKASIILEELSKLEQQIETITNDTKFEDFKVSLEAVLNNIGENIEVINKDNSGFYDELKKISTFVNTLDIGSGFQTILTNLQKTESDIKSHIDENVKKVFDLQEANITRVLKDISSNAELLGSRLNQTQSSLAILCEKNFGSVFTSIADLKNVVSQIDENSVSANNAIFSSITDRLTVFENSLKLSLDTQEQAVAVSSSQLAEQVENIKNLANILDYKMDSSVVEVSNIKREFSTLKSAIDDMLALDFANAVKDLRVDLYASKQELANVIDNTNTELSNKFTDDIYGKYELLISKIDYVEDELKKTQTNSLNGIKQLLENISGSIIDVISYVSEAKTTSSVDLDAKVAEISNALKENSLNYVENVRDVVDIIRIQVENNLEELNQRNDANFDSVKKSINLNSDDLKKEIKYSYSKLIELQDSYKELKELINVNNVNETNKFDNVISATENVKSEFDAKLSNLKNSLLDKISDFKQEFTCENADKISELKFSVENLNNKNTEIVENLVDEIKELFTSVTSESANSRAAALAKIFDNFVSIKEIITTLNTKSATELSEKVNLLIDDFSNVKNILHKVDETIDEDLTRQLSIIESNFESLVSQISILFEKADRDMATRITGEFEEISSKMHQTVLASLEEYKIRVENTIDSLQEKFSTQSSLLENKITEINETMKVAWEEQAEYNYNQINELANNLKLMLDENHKVSVSDYEALKSQMAEFAKNVEAENEILTVDLKAQIDDIIKYLDSVLDVQAQEQNAKLEELVMQLNLVSEGIVSKTKDIKDSLDKQSQLVNKNAQDLTVLQQMSADNNKKSDDIESLVKEHLELAKTANLEVAELNLITTDLTERVDNMSNQVATQVDLAKNSNAGISILTQWGKEHSARTSADFSKLGAVLNKNIEKVDNFETLLNEHQGVIIDCVNETNSTLQGVQDLVATTTEASEAIKSDLAALCLFANESSEKLDNVDNYLKEELNKQSGKTDAIYNSVQVIEEISAKSHEVAESLTLDVSALSQDLLANTNLVKGIEESLAEKVVSLKALTAEISAGELQALDVHISNLSEQIEVGKQHIKTCNDVLAELLKTELSNLTNNVEKETDIIVAELIEQFDLLKQTRSDDIIELTNRLDEIVSAHIYNNVEDLKAYLDIKTDNSVLNCKLDNLKKEMIDSVSDVLNLMNRLVDSDAFTSALTDFRTTSEVLLTSTVDKLNNKIELFIKENISTLSGLVENSVDNLNNKLETSIQDNITAIPATVSSSLEQLDKKLETFICENILTLTNTVEISNEELSNKIETFILENVATLSNSIKNSINNLDNKFESVVQDNISILSDSVKNSVDNLDNKLESVVQDNISVLSDSVNISVIELNNKIEDFIQNNVTALSGNIDSSIENLRSNLKSFVQETILTLSNNVEGALGNIENKIESCVHDNISNFSSSIGTTIDTANQDVIRHIVENKNSLEEKLVLFDKKFIDTVIDKYEEIKLLSNNYNQTYEEIKTSVSSVLTEFSELKFDIATHIQALITTLNETHFLTNTEIKQLSEKFEDLKTQISNKSFDEAFQASINNQVASLESLILEQMSYIEDINELCSNSLPDVTEMNMIVKYSVLESLKTISEKLDRNESIESVEQSLNKAKSEIVTQLINIFNQISFVTEQEEILDFIQEKHDELITILSHIVTTTDDVNAVRETVAGVDTKIESLKDDICQINDKINSIISSDGDIDYIYSLQDLESDIANLRLALKEIQENNNTDEFSKLLSSTNEIYALVEAIKTELPNRQDFEAMAEDIVSISTRTNKLILASDESYKTLQDNLQEFKLVVNDLDERTKNFAEESGLNRIDNKLNSINSIMQNGAKTNQVFNQVFEYLAEWVDNASVQINSISDKVNTLDEISQIKAMVEDLQANATDETESLELVEALGTVFEKQNKRISSLETKLDKIIVETTINNRNNELNLTPIEDTLNKFLVAMDEKLLQQQSKIEVLESKLSEVLDLIDEKDTTQLTKKVGGMDRQIAKLNKSIEKIASHVVEK